MTEKGNVELRLEALKIAVNWAQTIRELLVYAESIYQFLEAGKIHVDDES